MTEGRAEQDRHPFVPPPPFVYAGFFVVGLGLDYLWPLPVLAATVQYGVGFALVAAGLALFRLTLREFAKAGTSVDHRKPTTAVITSGPFARSRNPVYVSMTLCFVGAAVALDGPLVLAMVAPAVAVIHGFVIRREEAYMAQKFGVDYERYTETVRRWI